MKLVVIESPYRGVVARNVAYVRTCCKWAEDRGAAPFASHLFCTQFLNDELLEERRRGIAVGYQWMRVCDEVWFFEDLGWSQGMETALQVAGVLGKPCLKFTILTPEQLKNFYQLFEDSEKSNDTPLSIVGKEKT